MTEQGLQDKLATHGWMALPPSEERHVGRVAIFKGSYLHGVVGGNPLYPHRDAKRKVLFFCSFRFVFVFSPAQTLMIAFWEDVKIRPSLFQTPGACRPLPVGPGWVAEVCKPIPNLAPRVGEMLPVPLQFVKPFFASVTGADLEAMDMPEYDSIFQ